MRSKLLVLCGLSAAFSARAECGSKELPRSPVLHKEHHFGQWRLVALEGQDIKGNVIHKGNGNNGVVIRGHWAIGELELYEDPKCAGKKIATLEKDKSPLAPLDTTWGKGKDDADQHEFLESLVGYEKWYSEQRALDECDSSQFWSPCYQCTEAEAWYGWVFDDAAIETEIKCVKIIQKDADPYAATRIALEKWSQQGEDKVWGWKKLEDWKGIQGGRWFVLQSNTTEAIAGAPSVSTAAPMLLILAVFLRAIW